MTENTNQMIFTEDQLLNMSREELQELADKFDVPVTHNMKVETMASRIAAAALEAKEEEEAVLAAERAIQEEEQKVLATTTKDEVVETPTKPKRLTLDDVPDFKEFISNIPSNVTEADVRRIVKAEGEKLIRIKLTPTSTDNTSETGALVQVSNSFVNIGRLVPYNVPTHVENILFNKLRESVRIGFKTTGQGREKQTSSQLVPQYIIEVLPPLTKEEIEGLAEKQRKTRSLVDE